MTTVAAASIVQAHFAQSVAATTRFFEANAPAVADCCRQMAERFARGACLFSMGEGAQASDALHVSVEFVHPIIVGKRALPALALTTDAAASLQALARPVDIALGFAAGPVQPPIRAALAAARERGLLTVLIRGASPNREHIADIELAIDAANALVVQEVAETTYHVLWELVHVFFESEDAEQLFAYLPPAAGAARHDDLLAEVQRSTLQKARDVCGLRTAVQESCGARITEAARAIADRIRRQGRLLSFGNGGSATDAQDVAADCLVPPDPRWQRLPAIALVADQGIVTAIGNDVGFDHVFSRQVIAFGGAHDVALAFSTSGMSRNLVAAMTAARSRGMLTVAMSGGDGGALARSAAVDYCFTAPSDYLPRIQEVHATTWHALLAVIQEELR